SPPLLKLAMQRLKVPKIAILFILNLFDQRKAKVITHYSTSNKIIASVSIEQEE
ncbi:42437_t:CDS:1, partial [Gigaspora margarita]